MGMGQDAAQLFAASSHRAILVLKDTIVPMSSEFTPETERQRLQHLVSDSSHPSDHQPGSGRARGRSQTVSSHGGLRAGFN